MLVEEPLVITIRTDSGSCSRKRAQKTVDFWPLAVQRVYVPEEVQWFAVTQTRDGKKRSIFVSLSEAKGVDEKCL